MLAADTAVIDMAERLSADSALWSTSPSDSSISESPPMQMTMSASPYYKMSPSGGKNMNLMGKVQSSASRSNNTSQVPDKREVSQPRYPSQRNTSSADVLLNQFQTQMTQVRTAMDAVESGMNVDVSVSYASGAKKPRAPRNQPVGGGTRKRSRRGASAGKVLGGVIDEIVLSDDTSSTSFRSPSVMYQSQISASNGLKLKIKKSPSKRAQQTKSRKGKSKRRKYDDEDDLSDDIEYPKNVRNRKVKGKKEVELLDLEGDEGLEVTPSGWGTQLPEKVLHKILGHVVETDGCIPALLRVAKVCRLWSKVAMDPALWTNIDLTTSRIRDVYRSERNLAALLDKRFMHVENLNLGGWSSAVTNTTVGILARNCKSLKTLNLSQCQKLSGPNLKLIAESCPLLAKLDLSFINTTYNTKSAVSPIAIGETAEILGSRLTFLSLANNCVPNFIQIVNSLAENCPNLEVLDLSNVNSPRRDTLGVRIESLQQGCPNMRILRFTNSDVALSETPLKDQAASPGFPKLEELSIAVDAKRCVGIDDSDLYRIIKSSTKLRLLDVRGCTKITDSALVRVPAWDLENLYVSGCFATKSTNDGLELVVRKWRHCFREIDFSWMPNEEAINLAVRALGEVDDDGVPPLKKLDLLGSSVNFDSVKVILKKCSNLVSLNLTSCRALPRGIKRNYPNPWDVSALRDQVLSGKFDESVDD